MEMTLEHNFSLLPYNTFGLDVKATHFISVDSQQDLVDTLKQFQHLSPYILGGGSNVLFTKDYEGLIIKISIKGKKIIAEDDEHVLLKVGAGEVWHDVVTHAISNGWGGIENLSLIPGTAGAAPLQNIGAYGVELKDCFVELDAIDRSNGRIKTFNHAACQFGYRESIFKKEAKNKYAIANITLKLQKQPKLVMHYGAIQETLSNWGIEQPTIADVSKAVIQIRQSKLPDPSKIGNAGSFFKNPVVPIEKFEMLKEKNSSIPSYKVDDQHVKIPAGWLIEQAGWKGKRLGDIGVHRLQSLVLVNYGKGKGTELANLAQHIQDDILEKFGIKLTAEVNIIT